MLASAFATHTDPCRVAMLIGLSPTGIGCAASSPELASSRDTVFASRFETHTGIACHGHRPGMFADGDGLANDLSRASVES